MAECGETLVVGVALAAEVQFRLIADTNEECTGSSGAYLVAPNRKRPVPMSKTSAVRRFVSDRGQKSLFVGQAALYDIDLSRLRVIVRSDSPVERTPGVQPLIDIL